MKIIHPRPDDETGMPTNQISIIHPTDELPLEVLCRKDVPPGFPYLIVEDDVVPEKENFRAAWEADFSEPHGYGIGAKAWFIEQYQSEISAIEAADGAAMPDKAERIDQLNRQIGAMEQQP